MIYAQHLESEEFRDWSDGMSPRLITMMDVLRFMSVQFGASRGG